MKKKMMILALALMMVTAASAQNDSTQLGQHRPDHTEMVKMRTERTAKELGLNEEQTKQLLDLNTAYADKLSMGMRHMGGRGFGRGRRQGQRPDSVQQRTRPSKEQMEARMKEIQANREAYNAELKKILTDAQYSQYLEAQKKRMQRGPRGGFRQGGGRRGFGQPMPSME